MNINESRISAAPPVGQYYSGANMYLMKRFTAVYLFRLGAF